jgi:hypothetical protein
LSTFDKAELIELAKIRKRLNELPKSPTFNKSHEPAEFLLLRQVQRMEEEFLSQKQDAERRIREQDMRRTEEMDRL